MIQSRLFLLRDNGPYHTPGTMWRQPRQLFSASFSLTQLPFSHPAPRCLSSKCICAHLCAHGHAGLKTRCVQAHCWRVAILRNWNRLRHWPTKPGLKSMAHYLFFLYLKSALICTYRRVHNARTLCSSHTQERAAAHKHAKYKKLKDTMLKIIIVYATYIYKCLHVMMDSHCMITIATYLLAQQQLRFLSGDAFSLCACKFRRV